MTDNPRRRRRKSSKPKQVLNVQVGNELSNPLDDRMGALLIGGLKAVTDETLDDHSTEGYKLYLRMLRKDLQLGLCFRLRAQIVVSQGYNIVPGKDDPEDKAGLAAFVGGVFADVKNFSLSRKRFLRAVPVGFQPAEIIYKLREDGKIGIKCFKSRDPERFRFDKNDDLMLVGYSGLAGEKMPAANFMVNTWGSDETPYGEGLLRELYPLWHLKAHIGLKELVRFIEKFGTPFLWGSYPRGTKSDEQTALYDILRRMHACSVGMGPEGSDLKVVDTKQTSAIAVFKFLIEDYIDKLFAKAILGQVLSTESVSGTYALARFQSKTQQMICEEDAQWQQEQLDQVIVNLVDINFGPQPQGLYPHYRIPYEEDKDLDDFLRAVSVAINDLGLEVGEDWVREQVGFPDVGKDDYPLKGRKQQDMFGLDLRGAGKEGEEFDRPDKDKESGL